MDDNLTKADAYHAVVGNALMHLFTLGIIYGYAIAYGCNKDITSGKNSYP